MALINLNQRKNGTKILLFFEILNLEFCKNILAEIVGRHLTVRKLTVRKLTVRMLFVKKLTF